MLLSRSPGQIPGYTFARVSLVLVPSVMAAVVEVIEPFNFKFADSFGKIRISWDATLFKGVLTHLLEGGFTHLSS